MSDSLNHPSSSSVHADDGFEPPTSPEDLDSNNKKPSLEQIKQEREKLFTDLFADRRRSARSVIEEAFQNELMSTEPVAPNVPNPHSIPIRFRHQPVAGPAHDVFGDAVHSIFQKIMSRGVNADYCHWMSYWIALGIDKKTNMNYHKKPFCKDTYATEGSLEAKQTFTDKIRSAVEEIIWKSAEYCDILSEKWTGIHVSADQLKGQRNKQEDRFVAYPNGQYMNRGQSDISLLAVFDGHGGHECSQYAAAHFWEAWSDAQHHHSQNMKLDELLEKALETLDERMTVRSVRESWKGGTTAVCCAVDLNTNQIAFAWLGDSPGYIMSNLEFRKFTTEHSPSDPEECRRVEEVGGQIFVIGGELRVNGVLNLTRALGDVPGRPMISNKPDTVLKTIEPADYLVLLACDGISDVFNTSDLYNLVQAFVNEYDVEDYHELARYICNQAVSAGSADNVTVVIGFLRPPEDVWRVMKTDSDDEESELEEEDDNE
ncbi:unnamed protein product [Caenorhabditis brenneri]